LPVKSDGSLVTGQLGKDLTLEEGQEAARLIALQILATLKLNLGI
jgi:hypothetical protein